MSSANLHLTILVCACLAAVAEAAAAGHVSAATKKAKEAPSLAETKTTKASEQGEKPSVIGGEKTGRRAFPDKLGVLLPKQVKQAAAAESKAGSPIRHHRLKATKKVLPKAVIRPKSDLMFHGMLEDSQRYDPRLNHRTAGVQDPQTPELAHDHFQELDRNQDGKVDPVERAFGRLDMDRDLQKRQP